jgi:hypothetical protein
MSVIAGKIKANISSAKNNLSLSRSVKSSNENALYFKNSDILGTPSSGTTSCKITITCSNMKLLIEKVKAFKDNHISEALTKFKKTINDINATIKKDIEKDIKKDIEKAVDNAYNILKTEMNQSNIKIEPEIPITVNLGTSIKKEAEINHEGHIIELDIKKKIITVRYKKGKDKLVTEIKNLCVVELYQKTDKGFNCL